MVEVVVVVVAELLSSGEVRDRAGPTRLPVDEAGELMRVVTTVGSARSLLLPVGELLLLLWLLVVPALDGVLAPQLIIMDDELDVGVDALGMVAWLVGNCNKDGQLAVDQSLASCSPIELVRPWTRLPVAKLLRVVVLTRIIANNLSIRRLEAN